MLQCRAVGQQLLVWLGRWAACCRQRLQVWVLGLSLHADTDVSTAAALEPEVPLLMCDVKWGRKEEGRAVEVGMRQSAVQRQLS